MKRRACRGLGQHRSTQRLWRLEGLGVPPRRRRIDNGPEFIAEILQDWCNEVGINASYVAPGSPWQNGRIESLNSRLRDELLNREIFDSMWEIRTMLEEHRQDYSHYRPHSALVYMTPIEFVAKWNADNRWLTSQQVDR